MSSMKAEYLREVQAEMAKSRAYGDGYIDGAKDGYERALKDIRKLRGLAVEELLKGLKA